MVAILPNSDRKFFCCQTYKNQGGWYGAPKKSFNSGAQTPAAVLADLYKDAGLVIVSPKEPAVFTMEDTDTRGEQPKKWTYHIFVYPSTVRVSTTPLTTPAQREKWNERGWLDPTDHKTNRAINGISKRLFKHPNTVALLGASRRPPRHPPQPQRRSRRGNDRSAW